MLGYVLHFMLGLDEDDVSGVMVFKKVQLLLLQSTSRT